MRCLICKRFKTSALFSSRYFLEPLANQGLKTVNSNALPLNFFALVEISWVFRLETVLKLLRRKVTFSNNFASAQCGRILRTLGGIDLYKMDRLSDGG